MSNNPLKGFSYFFEGFSLILKPGIRQWVLIPLLINTLLFSVLIYYAWLYFPIAVKFVGASVQSGLPSWAWLIQLMRWLLLPLFFMFALFILFFAFTFTAHLIGEPFNALLAAAVEKHLTGKPVKFSSSDSWFKQIISFITEKVGKLFYYLKWAAVLLIISFIPLINIISPILWFLFGAWFACLEYADAPLGNHNYNFLAQRKLLAKKRMLSLGFGSAAFIAMLIPLINFLVMPIAVAAATSMWQHEFAESQFKS